MQRHFFIYLAIACLWTTGVQAQVGKTSVIEISEGGKSAASKEDSIQAGLSHYLGRRIARQSLDLAIPVLDTTAASLRGMDARQVIARYLQARGGKNRLGQLRNSIAHMHSTGQMWAWGYTTPLECRDRPSFKEVAANGKGYVEARYMGIRLGSRTYDGQQVRFEFEPSPLKMLQGYDFLTTEIRLDAYVVPELAYETLGCQTRLLGLLQLEKRPTYVLEVLMPSGPRQLDFFDVESGLKVRSIRETDEVVVGYAITDYKDYKPVAGVLFPHEVVLPLHRVQAARAFFYLQYMGIDYLSFPMEVRWEVDSDEADRIFHNL